MKIAILTDIHANFMALETVLKHIDDWKPHRVVVAGDIINRGPRPSECLETVLERKHTNGWQLIRGNHEDYVIDQYNPQISRKCTFSDVHQASAWTLAQLNFDISSLVEMPFLQDIIDPNGKLIRTVHGTMLGNRDGIYPETTDDSLVSKLGINQLKHSKNLAVFCVGHTHRPLVRRLNNTLIVNAGSVGLPFDGDQRACYAQLFSDGDTWDSRIVRLKYAIDQAALDFHRFGYIFGGGPLVELVLLELWNAESHLYHWSSQYQTAVLNGEITMRESVRQYLSKI
jgi:putative phosphoesterase